MEICSIQDEDDNSKMDEMVVGHDMGGGRYNEVSRDLPTKKKGKSNPHPPQKGGHTYVNCVYGHASRYAAVILDLVYIFRIDDMIVALRTDDTLLKSGCSVFVFLRV